ncbi:MAG: type I restriction endonuclease subunit R [Limnothrix sp. RL_2_0]|nr:type I restriction endonuclease subunit R [Limnothrix sp. RL_2_0]
MSPIADTLSLHTLRDRAGLTRSDRCDFFTEWQNLDQPLTEANLALVDRLTRRYRYYFDEALMQEEAIKMTLISPILETVGFYDPPFYTDFERSIRLDLSAPEDPDQSMIYRGRIDTLVILETLWILTIESKNMRLSVENGLAQLLAYMLESPNRDRATFGLLANGTDFLFVKLDHGADQSWNYALSRKFSMQTDGDLGDVLRILDRLKVLALDSIQES